MNECRELAIAIIARAVKDLASDDPDVRAEASAWLDDKDECGEWLDMAGMDYEALQRCMKKAEATNE